jgi:hypothetical protein
MTDLDFTGFFINRALRNPALAIRKAAAHTRELATTHASGNAESRWSSPHICQNGEATTLFYYNIACRDCGRLFVDARGPKTNGGLVRCENCRELHKQKQGLKRRSYPKPRTNNHAACGAGT